MLWLNLDVLKGTSEQVAVGEQSGAGGTASATASASRKNARPAKRWGQAAVHANNRLYIIGGYEGRFNQTLKFDDKLHY